MKIHYSKLLVKKVFLITERGNHINVMKMLLLNVKIHWFVSEFAEMGFNDGDKIVSSLLRFLTTLLPDGKWKQERKKERKKGYERCTLNLSVVILWLLMQSEELYLKMNQLLLAFPKTRLKTIGNRAFPAIIPKLWNDLSAHVRMASSLPLF